MRNFRRTIGRALPGALAGLVSGFTALAVAELAARLTRPAAGPVTVVGGAVIDRTPAPVKDFAVRTFGENDKNVLLLGLLAVLALVAIGLGLPAVRNPHAGAAGVLLFGLVGAAAALGRPDAAGRGDSMPSVAGACAGAAALYLLMSRSGPAGEPAGAGSALNRRGFLTAAAVTAAAATGAGALGRYLPGRRSQDAVASRNGVVLPAPASPAPPVPAGARLDVPGISAFTTTNRDFYRVDTALVVPRIDAGTWRLVVRDEGVVRPRTFTFDDLLARPLIERDITLTCVSNEVGGPYIGTARWLGVPMAGLLAECGVRPPSKGDRADRLVARSVDGMTPGSPVEEVVDGRDAVLAGSA